MDEILAEKEQSPSWEKYSKLCEGEILSLDGILHPDADFPKNHVVKTFSSGFQVYNEYKIITDNGKCLNARYYQVYKKSSDVWVNSETNEVIPKVIAWKEI